MTVYVVAQLRFTDRDSYDRYARQFFSVFRQFDGTLLAADEKPIALEGRLEWDKVVLLSFPSQEALSKWADSPAYRTISVNRSAGTESSVIQLQGSP